MAFRGGVLAMSNQENTLGKNKKDLLERFTLRTPLVFLNFSSRVLEKSQSQTSGRKYNDVISLIYGHLFQFSWIWKSYCIYMTFVAPLVFLLSSFGLFLLPSNWEGGISKEFLKCLILLTVARIQIATASRVDQINLGGTLNGTCQH